MLIQFSMFPVGSGESASGEVSKIIDIIDKSGLAYKMSSMSTVIEGEWDDIIPVINQCRLKLKESNDRIYMIMTMDDRKGARSRIEGKVESIERKLNRKIKK